MDRRALESRLDELVRDNRFTIAVVFPSVGALLLTASAASVVPEPLSFNPYLILAGTLVMRLPLVAGLAPLVDRRVTVALLALTAYTYGIEFVGVTTGLPYGEFTYLIGLGPMIADVVPLGLPVFFFPLVVNAYLLVLLLGPAGPIPRIVLTATTVLTLDLILDPAAVSLGFWTYVDGGLYYGVPVQNYLGWILSAIVAVGLLEAGFPSEPLRSRLESCVFILDDMISFVILWGVINAYYANVVPVLLALGLFAVLWAADRFDIPIPWVTPGSGG